MPLSAQRPGCSASQREPMPNCVTDRRPEGYAPTRSASERAVGAHFAELEAASVYAFERLVLELGDHSAPSETPSSRPRPGAKLLGDLIEGGMRPASCGR